MNEAICELTTKLHSVLSTLKGKNIELEIRIGQINDIQSDNRLTLPIKQAVIFYPNKIYKFKPGVSELEFDYFTEKLKKLSTETEKKIDEYKDKQLKKKEARINIRDGEIVENIIKRKLFTYDLYLPNELYDVRVSVSEEAPSGWDITIDRINSGRNLPNLFKRERTRKELKDEDYIYHLTKVHMNDMEAKEVEIELKPESFDDKEKIKKFLVGGINFLQIKYEN